MLQSIIAAFLKIVESILGIWKTKEEVKKEEFKVKNTEIVIRRAEIVEDVKQKDVAEDLVKQATEAKNEVDKKRILDEIRRRVST